MTVLPNLQHTPLALTSIPLSCRLSPVDRRMPPQFRGSEEKLHLMHSLIAHAGECHVH